MGILYAMVARGHVVLAEFSAAAASNAGAVARQILEKQLPQGNADSNASYSQDRYVFHVKRTDGLVVLCMADDASESMLPFSFHLSPGESGSFFDGNGRVWPCAIVGRGHFEVFLVEGDRESGGARKLTFLACIGAVLVNDGAMLERSRRLISLFSEHSLLRIM